MAGSDPRFPAAEFEAAIRFAMQMGLPDSTLECPTFTWKVDAQYANTDVSGKPYAVNGTPITSTQHPPVQVDCVVEYLDKQRLEQSSVGEFDPAKATIYLIKSDFDQVKTADEVLMAGSTYKIKTVGYPISLFTFEMYPMYVETLDQKG